MARPPVQPRPLIQATNQKTRAMAQNRAAHWNRTPRARTSGAGRGHHEPPGQRRGADRAGGEPEQRRPRTPPRTPGSGGRRRPPAPSAATAPRSTHGRQITSATTVDARASRSARTVRADVAEEQRRHHQRHGDQHDHDGGGGDERDQHGLEDAERQGAAQQSVARGPAPDVRRPASGAAGRDAGPTHERLEPGGPGEGGQHPGGAGVDHQGAPAPEGQRVVGQGNGQVGEPGHQGGPLGAEGAEQPHRPPGAERQAGEDQDLLGEAHGAEQDGADHPGDGQGRRGRRRGAHPRRVPPGEELGERRRPGGNGVNWPRAGRRPVEHPAGADDDEQGGHQPGGQADPSGAPVRPRSVRPRARAPGPRRPSRRSRRPPPRPRPARRRGLRGTRAGRPAGSRRRAGRSPGPGGAGSPCR